jgi:hypothetical protein
MKKASLLTVLALLLAVHAFSQTFQWARQITGNQREEILDMTTDANGNVYVVGFFTGTITLGQTYTAQGTDIWLAKYNSSGNLLWGKAIPDVGVTPGDDIGHSITLDNNNNVYICGTYLQQKNFNPGGTGGTTSASRLSGFIAKYNTSGIFQWVKSIEVDHSGFNAIAFSSAQSRIYIGGFFTNPGSSNADFDPSPSGDFFINSANGRAFIASYTLDGNFVNAQNFGATSNIKDLAVDPSGNVYATGYLGGSNINLNPNGPGTSYNPADGRMFVAKYNADITFISASQITSNSSTDEGLTIIAPANDQIFYGGTVNGGLYLARRNSSFGLVYEKHYGGGGAVTAIATDGSNLFFSASSGTTVDLGNGVIINPVSPGGNIYLAKSTLSGVATWGVTIPFSNELVSPSTSTAIKAVGSNQVVLAGYFSGSTDFNACGNTTLLSANGTDGFMVRYSGERWSDGITPISGPTLVCGLNATFSVSGLAPGISISWTNSANLTYVSGQGTANYVVRAASGAQGAGWVQAVVSGPCGTETLPRHDIDWVGTPTITSAGKIGSCYEPVLVYRAPIISGATYAWSINTNRLSLSPSGFETYVENVSVADGSAQSFNLTVSITQGGCTVTRTISAIYTKPTKCDCGYNDPSCGGSGGPPSPLSVYPVPADDQLTISVSSDQGNSDEVLKEVTIFNSQQIAVLSNTKINKKEVVLNVAHLPTGLYYVHITTQKRVEVRQVFIE